MAEHHFHPIRSGTDISHNREGRENVDKADRIVKKQSPRVAFRNLRSVGRNQICKDGKKGNRSIVGYNLHKLHHHGGKTVQKLRHLLSRFSTQIHGKTEKQGKNNQRKHRLTGK